jgi:cobalt-zinc-cadmium efflux system membrane fusion protein
MKNILSKTKYTTLLLLISTTLGSAVVSTNVIASNEQSNKEQHNDVHVDSHADKHNDEKPQGHEGEHDDKHGDEHSEEEGHIEITTTNALKAGIINATASSGQVKKMTTVYGRSVIVPNAISQVSARFPGLITKLSVNVGDVVTAGDNIAQVESNDSLKRYTITAPISGVVTERHVNPGELANQQPLLTIENYDRLWVEFKVFPSQQQAISKGQQVTILSTHAKTQSNIMHLMATKNQPFITVIVPLENDTGLWAPGQMLTGSIITSQVDVSLTIDNRAFQEIEGKNVIFITNKNGYETRELELGQTDGQFTEVISGLQVGDQYALINSYLLKADLGKAGASHAH